MRPINLLLAAVFAIFAGTNAFSVEYNVTDQHQGVLELANGFFIFPHNRFDNALYDAEKNFLYTRENSMVMGFAEIPEGKAYFVRGRDEAEPTLIFESNPGVNAVFQTNNNGQALMETDGEKKVLRFVDGEIQTLPITYRSARGLVYNGSGASAFYHIRTSSSNENGDTVYGVTVHVLKNGEDAPEALRSFTSARSSIDLTWDSPDTLRYSTGAASETVSVR